MACGKLASHQLVIRYAFGTVEARWNGTDLGRPVSLFTPYVHALKAVSHAVFLAALLFDEPSGVARDAHLAAAVRDIEALRVDLNDPLRRPRSFFPPPSVLANGILSLTLAALGALRTAARRKRARRLPRRGQSAPNDNLRRPRPRS